jgi:hypothetical protein
MARGSKFTLRAQPGVWAGVLAQLASELPLDAGVDGCADGRRLLFLPIRGFDPGDGLGDGCEHVLGIPGPGAGEDLEHGGLEVSALFLGVPGTQGRLGDDVQDGGD